MGVDPRGKRGVPKKSLGGGGLRGDFEVEGVVSISSNKKKGSSIGDTNGGEWKSIFRRAD